MNPLVSVIIPGKNCEKTIGKCIDSVLKLDHPSFEVIVVNDGSNDNTKNILDKYQGIFVINTGGVGPSGARNLAVRQAKGEYVAFTDADCIVDKQWLNELLKGFKSDDIAGVGGNQQSPADETEFGKSIQEFIKQIGFVTDYIKEEGSDFKQVQHNPTCNVMYRRKAFEKVGGFLEGLWPGEDVEFDYRITRKEYKLLYNPKAVVYHYRSENQKKFRMMMLNYGRVQAFLVKKYGFFRKIQLVPPALLAIGIFEVVLLAKTPLYGIMACLFVLLFIYIFFLIRTMSVKKSLKNFKLFMDTVIFWNFGFIIRTFKR